MENVRLAVESYLQQVDEYKQCLIACINDANTEAELVIDDWNSAVSRHKDRRFGSSPDNWYRMK